VLEGIRNVQRTELVLDACLLVLLLIALRLLWVFASSWITSAVLRLLRRPDKPPRNRETLILGWSGMRGVITLAAAMSLPDVVSSGVAFPQRDLLIFLSFCVILTTLILQGLSLPYLIRKLGLSTAGEKP
jgi:CPA1 family monovalent cation:H+ antiporter